MIDKRNPNLPLPGAPIRTIFAPRSAWTSFSLFSVFLFIVDDVGMTNLKNKNISYVCHQIILVRKKIFSRTLYIRSKKKETYMQDVIGCLFTKIICLDRCQQMKKNWFIFIKLALKYLRKNKMSRLERLFVIRQENNYQTISTKHLTFSMYR